MELLSLEEGDDKEPWSLFPENSISPYTRFCSMCGKDQTKQDFLE